MRPLPVIVMAIALGMSLPHAATQRAAPAPIAGQVRQYLDEWRAAAAFPGVSAGIVLPDGTPVAVTSGVADRAAQTPMRAEDLLLAGSTGKTFFAAVAVQLIESGALDLDAPISQYLADRSWFRRLPNADKITVRHLMTHTSGLVRYEMNPKFTADLRAQPDKVWTPEEEVAYLFDATPPFAAGQGWDYSDTNYIVLGMIVESITKTTLYDEVRRRFLTPLGLTRIVPSTSRRIPGLVPGYAGPRDPLGLPDRVVVDGQFVINPQFEWTGGGYATSAGDLARWGHELYAGRAISAKARALMIDAAVPARLGPETRYGLGVIVRSATPVGVTWGHSGFFPGYQTELVHATASGVTVAVQINTSAPRATGNRSLLRAAYDLVALAAGQAAAPTTAAAPQTPAAAPITIDVAVVDAEGRPVTHLTAGDFRVVAGGASRRVIEARYSAASRAINGPTRASTATLGSSTNTKPFAGRTTLFVADVGSIPEGLGAAAFAALGKYVASIDPADRVGLIDVPLGTPRIDATTDRHAFRAAMPSLTGTSTRLAEPAMTIGEASRIHAADPAATLAYWERTKGGGRGCGARMPRPYAAPAEVSSDCREAAARVLERHRRDTQSRLELLRGMIEPMTGVDGLKTLVLLGGGLWIDDANSDALNDLSRMAERAGVVVYALQVEAAPLLPSDAPESRTAALDDRAGYDGLARLAAAGRGAAIRIASSPDAALARLDAELSGAYTLSFERSSQDADGHVVPLDVRVDRPGLEVRSRVAFTPGPAVEALVPRDADLRARVDEMIKRPIAWTGIGLDAAASPLVASSRDEVPVAVVIELDRPAKALTALGFEIASAANGRAVTQSFETSPPLRTLGSRALFTTTVEMKPGSYKLKVAAIDDDGRRGSVEHRFEVPEVPPSGVRVSEVLLGDDSTGQFRPVVRITPDLRSIVARVELAANAATLNGLAAAVTIAPLGQVTSADDAVAVPIVTMQGSQRRFAAARVDLRSLPPGAYAITLAISSRSGDIIRRTRVFEK